MFSRETIIFCSSSWYCISFLSLSLFIVTTSVYNWFYYLKITQISHIKSTQNIDIINFIVILIVSIDWRGFGIRNEKHVQINLQ